MHACIDFISGRLDLQTSVQYFSTLGIFRRASGMLYGNVDHTNQGKNVKGIFYDIHFTLAKKAGDELAKQTAELYPGLSSLYFSHSYDFVQSGELCTVLSVTGDNWKTVDNSLSFFIQEMKKKLPIWKLEHYFNDMPQWLTFNSLSQEEYNAK